MPLARLSPELTGVSTLYLAPFHDGLKEKYLKRRFGRMKDGNRSRVSQAIHNVGAFRDRPILLNHADDFIQSSGKQDHAFNALETITEACLERESKTSKVSKDAMRNDCINLAQPDADGTITASHGEG